MAFEYPEVFDQYKRPNLKEETGGGKVLVDPAGYIPADIQIENMMNAGIRLQEARAAAYDYASAEEVEDGAMDPTRSGSFDMADASQALLAIEAKAAAAEKAAAVPPVKAEDKKPEGEAK